MTRVASVTEVAREISVAENSLFRWVRDECRRLEALEGTSDEPLSATERAELVRLRIDDVPRVVEQAYSVSSSPWPPSSKIEITVRDVRGGRVSPLLAHQVCEGDQFHVHGPFGDLTWDGTDTGPLLMIGAGSGVAPLVSILRFVSARRSTVPMTLLYSSRDRASVLFRTALEELDRRED